MLKCRKSAEECSFEEIRQPDEIENYIKALIEMAGNRFYGELDNGKLLMGALMGIVNCNLKENRILDINLLTVRLLKEIYKSMGRFCDFFPRVIDNEWVLDKIGIRITCTSDCIKVCHVYPSTPAHNAGILAGDKIIDINGKNLKGESIHNISTAFTPDDNKKVFGIIRPGEKDVIYKGLSVGENEKSRVFFLNFRDIAYIRIQSFGEGTYASMSEALNLIDDADIKNIILDLRNNSGGSLKQAVLTARRFVPEGLITRLESKSAAFKEVEYRSELKSTKYRVAVLVNEGTASSAEILAGAIQDAGTGILVGTNTFGKADVMREFEILSYEAFVKSRKMTGAGIVDAGELRAKYGFYPTFDGIIGTAYISVARYITPGGKMIDGIGLIPDIFVEDPELTIPGEPDSTIRESSDELFKLLSKDGQLLKAYEFLIREKPQTIDI